MCRKWILISIKDESIYLFRDLFEALSTTTNFVSTETNRTLQEIFGTSTNTIIDPKRMISDLMHKGELPLDYIQKNIVIGEELKLLDEALKRLKIVISIALALNVLCSFILIFIIRYF